MQSCFCWFACFHQSRYSSQDRCFRISSRLWYWRSIDPCRDHSHHGHSRCIRCYNRGPLSLHPRNRRFNRLLHILQRVRQQFENQASRIRCHGRHRIWTSCNICTRVRACTALCSETVATVEGVTPAVIAAAAKAAQRAHAASLEYVWYTSIAFGVLSIVACLFLGQVRPYLTHRIAVELA
jgi:hypothetical protein